MLDYPNTLQRSASAEQSHLANTKVSFPLNRMDGLAELQKAAAHGDPGIVIAVLDGPVARNHPCFAGARLLSDESAEQPQREANARMLGHGTHVASLLFGRNNVFGIAPRCTGLVLPIFSDLHDRLPSQSELARVIQRALSAGAHVINISAGELSTMGRADPSLAAAVRECEQKGVLIVAAAGNDACSCLHVPAALPSVLAVGAMDGRGAPLDSSNWGDAYRTQGVLAPGENLLGALPGGGVCLRSGTSFATPIVTGIAALLLCRMLQQGKQPDPHAVRAAILDSVVPCDSQLSADSCERFMAGVLNVSGAHALISSRRRYAMHENNDSDQSPPLEIVESSDEDTSHSLQPSAHAEGTSRPAPSSRATIRPAAACGCTDSTPSSYVYAIGSLGVDFGTEARRDAFKQLMPRVGSDGLPFVPGSTRPDQPPLPPNPYDARQIVNYLAGYPSPEAPFPTEGGLPALKDQPPLFPPRTAASTKHPGSPSHMTEAAELIWTLNIEQTPVYAIKPSGSFDTEVYQRLVAFLAGQIANPDDDRNYVSRVSIPGRLTGESVRLFSGQVVPVVCPQVRGMFAWNENMLVELAVERIADDTEAEKMRAGLRNFLDRIYYDLRNPGLEPRDRALNFAATNAFQAAVVLTAPAVKGMFVDDIVVERSAFCRKDADCWDVRLRFFDPENDRRARNVYRFTIDVSAQYPVTVGPVRQWYAPR